jgi:thioredoxin reductase
VRGYGGQIVSGTVEKAERIPEEGGDGDRDGVAHGFNVTMTDSSAVDGVRPVRAVRGRRLLVTTGIADGLPPIPGAVELWGRDLHVCPYCHGWEVRDQPIAVIGTGAFSVHHALLIRQWSDDVVFFRHTMAELDAADRDRLTARGIRVVEGEVTRLVVGDGRLTGIELADGTFEPRSAAFLMSELHFEDSLLTGLGATTAEAAMGLRTVVTDALGRTDVPGVFAAGSVVDPSTWVISAAASGAKVAAGINMDLVEEEVQAAVRRLQDVRDHVRVASGGGSCADSDAGSGPASGSLSGSDSDPTASPHSGSRSVSSG